MFEATRIISQKTEKVITSVERCQRDKTPDVSVMQQFHNTVTDHRNLVLLLTITE